MHFLLPELRSQLTLGWGLCISGSSTSQGAWPSKKTWPTRSHSYCQQDDVSGSNVLIAPFPKFGAFSLKSHQSESCIKLKVLGFGTLLALHLQREWGLPAPGCSCPPLLQLSWCVTIWEETSRPDSQYLNLYEEQRSLSYKKQSAKVSSHCQWRWPFIFTLLINLASIVLNLSTSEKICFSFELPNGPLRRLLHNSVVSKWESRYTFSSDLRRFLKMQISLGPAQVLLNQNFLGMWPRLCI